MFVHVGLHLEWWAEAMQRFGFLWNRAPGDGRSSSNRLRVGTELHGTHCAFDAAVIYKPTKDEYFALTHTCHSK